MLFTQWFIDTVAESISENIKDYLSGIGVECDGDHIDGIRHTDNVFGKLSSRHYRDNYYASAFNNVVSITSGTSITNNNNY